MKLSVRFYFFFFEQLNFNILLLYSANTFRFFLKFLRNTSFYECIVWIILKIWLENYKILIKYILFR